MNKLATVLLCANFITVLFPQPGYIHPDEFFQSSEIVAGDILDVHHFRVWEFNGTSAVRNIVFPYLVMAPSLYLLRWINSTGISEFQLSAVKVVMATRLPVAFLSLLGYIATGRLADCFNVNKYVSHVLYCSSYVTWTYYTRTFSNSIESVLLAVVLLLVLTFSEGTSVYHRKGEIFAADVVKSRLKSESTEGKVFDACQKFESKSDKELVEDEKQNNARIIQTKTVKQTLTKSHDSDTESPEETDRIEKEIPEEIYSTEKESSEETEKAEKDDTREAETSKRDYEDKHADTKKNEPGNIEMTKNNTELSNLRAYIADLVSVLLGVVVAAGFFNRPTFLVFAFIPVVYWIWTVTQSDSQGRWHGVPLISIIFSFSFGTLFTFAAFVLLDTLYFNPEFLTLVSQSLKACADDHYSLQSLQTSLLVLASSLVITPWNFLNYNSNVNNLAQHGIHPRITHFLVNLPLLLGPLFIPFIIVSVMSIYQIFRKSIKTDQNNFAWLSLMAFVPVIGLSVFPHQEPRFLIPALPIFIVMGAKTVSVMTPGKLSFFALWATFNILLTLIYGYMHQAALIPALSIYQQKLSSSSDLSKNYHAIFYKTYSPPRHLLLLHPNSSQVSIHELAGAPLDTLLQTVTQVQSLCHKSETSCHINVFLPSTVTPRVLDRMSDNKVSTTSICPHLSMEAPPRFWAWWKKRLSFDELIMDFCLNILTLT